VTIEKGVAAQKQSFRYNTVWRKEERKIERLIYFRYTRVT